MKKDIKSLLKNKLTKKEISLLPKSFDVVGDLLIFSGLPRELNKKEKIIGKIFLDHHKNINTVLKKTKKYSGKFRLPKLKFISGKRKKETTYKENNIVLKLNIENTYFSPRLSNERKRINKLVKKNERLLVMFSGVGVIPINIAKNTGAGEIYGIEINPIAHKYSMENLKLNKVENKVKLFLGDVKKLTPKLKVKFDRILMPLPKGAGKFLDLALKKIRKNGIIHFYDFSDENKYRELSKKIEFECKKQKKKFKILRIVKCGQFSPRVYRVCVDFKIL